MNEPSRAAAAPARAIRHAYEEMGVEGYYRAHGADYRNPHEADVRFALAEATRRWPLNTRRVLDLACGSGEATLALRTLGAGEIEGADPHTGAAYAARVGQPALPFSFEQIAAGALAERRYSLVVCSHALHLLERSRLPELLCALARAAPDLLIVSPHQRPELRDDWGWRLQGEFRARRLRVRWLARVDEASG